MSEKKADIKIFVSHRIDLDSETIDNPLYVPVRCGAVYDKRTPEEIGGMLGDNTGDNISEKRMSFCEFTVQYWAWKNVKADYYGLCHYRRYLSFSLHHFKTDAYNMICTPVLTTKSQERYGLLNQSAMERLISDYDIIVSEYANVQNIPTPKGRKNTVRELWDAHDGIFFEKFYVALLLELVAQMAPEYSQSAQEYFAGGKHRGFNCYILKSELFGRLCEFQFKIMFEVERRMDIADYSQTMLRTPAFLGEMLYGIFIYHVTTREQWKIKELQLIFWGNTARIKGRVALLIRYLSYWLNCGIRLVVDPIIPKGSHRRELIKRFFTK